MSDKADLALQALSPESVREEALEEAAKVCERQIRTDEAHGRLQAKSILTRCAAAIRALQHSPARVAEGKEQPWQRTRREVLIEAAMKCRDIQYEHLGPLYDNVAPEVKCYHNGMAKGADCCEYAIRQLADSHPSSLESPPKEQPGEQHGLGIPAARRRAVWRSMSRAHRLGDVRDLERNAPMRLAVIRDYHRRWRRAN